MSQPERRTTPVFIHSLFRSGSTYLFSVFRRSATGYWCYQEPENEFLRYLDNGAEMLLQMGSDTAHGLRHSPLDRPYFWEFYQVRDALSGLFRKSFSYDDFFVCSSNLPEDQTKYFDALIANAKGRPVLQLCRSAGRIGALKNTFAGTHIHLWREPRNQWWSFKINDYFDSAVLLIYGSRLLPAVLEETKHRCGIPVFHSEDIEKEFQDARKHPLGASANYFAFYALWLYAYLEGEKDADIAINIDKLSTDKKYRNEVRQSLEEARIEGLDFSDCSVPRAVFTEDESEFFTKIEHQVQKLFLLHGYSDLILNEAVKVHKDVLQLHGAEPANLLRDAARAREMALRYLDQCAEVGGEAEARAVEAEVRATGAKARAAEAEARAAEAEARATEAEARATEAEARAAEAEARAAEAEARAAEAEARAAEAEARAIEAEARASKLKSDLTETHAANHYHWQLSEDLKRQIHAGCQSYFGRITASLRKVGHAGQHMFCLFKAVKPKIKLLVLHTRLYANRRPGLKRAILFALAPFPVMEKRLRQAVMPISPSHLVQSCVPPELANLTPQARRIYSDLVAAIEQNRKEA